MNLERVLDRLDAKLDLQDEKFDEFREQMYADVAEIKERLAVLETQQDGNKDGVRTFGWVLTFCVSLAALGVSLFH